jgi:hypothetical protein
MRTNLAKAQAHIDGEIAQSDADLAEVYALDAVDFVLAAVGEAESGGAGCEVFASQRSSSQFLIGADSVTRCPEAQSERASMVSVDATMDLASPATGTSGDPI